MARPFPRAYGIARGYVVSASGQRLSKAACTAALARLLAVSADPSSSQRTAANAKAEADQLTAAMAASFTDQTETLL